MRISTSYQFETYARGIDTASKRVFDAQTQVETGKKLTKPSDDPYGTSNAINMTSLKSGLSQYMSNLTTAKGTLDYTESSLSDVTDLLNQANQLALQGAN